MVRVNIQGLIKKAHDERSRTLTLAVTSDTEKQLASVSRRGEIFASMPSGDDRRDDAGRDGGEDEIRADLTPFIARRRRVEMVLAIIDAGAAIPILMLDTAAPVPVAVFMHALNVVVVLMVVVVTIIVGKGRRRTAGDHADQNRCAQRRVENLLHALCLVRIFT